MTKATELREILEKLYWHDRKLAVSRKRTNEAIENVLNVIQTHITQNYVRKERLGKTKKGVEK